MTKFSAEVLKIDPQAVSQRMQSAIRGIVIDRLRRRGVVVGLSGGIDSSVTAAICVRALGAKRVFGIFMPEEDSSSDSLQLGRILARSLGIETVLEDIGPTLRALGCYRRRDDAIRTVIPEYGDGWKSKIVLPSVLDSSPYALFSVVAQSPTGEIKKARMSADAYLGVVAATNFKQRTRKMIEYYHADRLWYAVAGTPNRLEYAQGFFVKNGDGAADFKPIAHLYKSQVYDLARFLEVPQEIISRPPTTDTYSLEQTQEEFYFAVPLELLDLCLYAKNHQVDVAQVSTATGLTEEQVKRVYASIDSKIRVSQYLHSKALLIEEVDEVKVMATKGAC
ncbi:MAG TPA: NAD(+) synthase [Candidatus Nanoarchaeia archaeon]|nr:NAD(+) synthase [Candidatus Nanoarchaeia archaeon]